MEITLHKSEVDSGLGRLQPVGVRVLLQLAEKESGEKVVLIPVPDGTPLPDPQKRDWLYELMTKKFGIPKEV